MKKALILLGIFAVLFPAFGFAEQYSPTSKVVKTPTLLQNYLNELTNEVEELQTAVAELVSDHATFKAVVDELAADHATFRAVTTGDYLIDAPALSTPASATLTVASGAFRFVIDGTGYAKAAVSAGTALSPTTVIPQSTYGGFCFDIASTGTIRTQGCAAQATGYTSAALALAALPAVDDDYVRMGTMTIVKSDGAFTPGTTAVNAANVTVAYADGTSWLTAPPAALSNSAPATLSASSPTDRVSSLK